MATQIPLITNLAGEVRREQSKSTNCFDQFVLEQSVYQKHFNFFITEINKLHQEIHDLKLLVNSKPQDTVECQS